MTAVVLAGEKRNSAEMIEAAARFACIFFSEVLVIVSKNRKAEELDLARATALTDLFENHGLLAGLYTGLSYALDKACFVMTCEPQFLDEELVRRMAGFYKDEKHDIACFEDPSGQLRPFPGVYLRSTRHLIRLLLERGETSLSRLLEAAVVGGFPLEKPGKPPVAKAS